MLRTPTALAVLCVGTAACLEALPPPPPRSILAERGPYVSIRLLEAPSGTPLANAPVKVSLQVQCEAAPCGPVPQWEGRTDERGVAAIPKEAVQEGVLVEAPGHAAYEMVAHASRAGSGEWTLELPRPEAGGQGVVPALVGRWRQSAWALCKPVPALGANEVDPPIQELIFKEDGGFSVTWHPFEVYHDYRGTFRIDARTGAIELKRLNGNFKPTDFDGHGTFRVEANVLTLRHVWFGTKKATRTPDVCEITFARY